MALKFGKRTLFISLFAVLAILCMALSICFLLPTSSASATGNDHDHSDDSWYRLLNTGDILLSEGNYYVSPYLKWKSINYLYVNIKITGDVTLCLNGNALISAVTRKVVIDIAEGATLTLCDCNNSGNNNGRITGASRSNSYGGGGVFLHEGATLNMYGGTISGNKAGYGGGVYVDTGATFNMYGGTISDNKAKYEGGGVYVGVGGTFNMTGGFISSNTSTSKSGGGGGVWLARHATFNLSDGNIAKNTAKGNGGGVWAEPNSTFTMKDSTISWNTSTKGYGGGVGIGAGATFTMNGGIIYNNTVNKHDGGGVYVYGNSSGAGSFIINSGTIQSNTAEDTHLGGGVCVYGGTLTMNGGTITYNHALWGGGVWMWGGAFNMYGGAITNNYVYGATKDYNGGGVWVSGGTFNMYDGCITGNYHMPDYQLIGSFNDGLYISSDGYFYMYGGYIGDYVYTDNIKRLSDSSTVTLTNNIEAADSTSYNLTYNVLLIAGTVIRIIYEYLSKPNNLDNVTLIYSESAVIYTSSDKVNVVVKDSMDDGETHTHNSITFDKTITTIDTLTTVGEGKYYLTSSVLNLNTINIPKGETVYLCLNGCTIDGYYSSNSVITVESGGTLYLYDCQSTGKITGGDVSGSTSDAAGGGVNVKGTFTMYGGTISGNTAMYGGGVSVYTGGTFTMSGGKITGNTATSNGGGVEVFGGTFTMSGGTISGNTAKSNGGGVCVDNQGKLLTTGGTFTMSGGTISGNTATGNGGGVYVDYKCKTTMSAGTISDNIAKASGGGAYVGESGEFYMTGGAIIDNKAVDGYDMLADKAICQIKGGYISGGQKYTESDSATTFSLSGGGVVVNGGTCTINSGAISDSIYNNDCDLTVYSGYFSSTAYSSIKDSISSQSIAVSVSAVSVLYGTQLYSTDSDYTYAVYEKSDCTIGNITVTYGETYTVNVSGTYVDREIVYAYGDYIGSELPTEAGTYEVTATIFTKSSDGTIRANTVTFTIVIQQKELAEDMFSITGTYIYNGTEQKAEYTYEDTDGDNAVLTSDDFDVTYSYNTSAGTATVTFTGKGNYSGSVTLTYEIEKADYDASGLSLTNKTVTYNGSAQVLEITGTLPTGVTVTYYYEGTNGTTYERTTTAPTNAGYYTVTAVFSGDENYNAISSLTADLTIEKASYDTSSLTLEDVTVTYNGEAQAVTVSGLPDGVEVTVYYTGAYSTVYEKSTVAPTDVGIYFVTAVFSGDFDNYNAISKLTSTLTIEKAATEVEALNITAKVGDSLEDIELPEGWTWSDTATFTSSGDYVVYATYSADDNYEAVTTAVTVSVTGYSSSDKFGIAAIVIGCATFAVCASVITLFFFKKKKV